MSVGCGAWGMGHGAWGMGHGAWGAEGGAIYYNLSVTWLAFYLLTTKTPAKISKAETTIIISIWS